MEKETKNMNISPAFVLGLQKTLDILIENEEYIAQIGAITIRNEGVIEDTANGKKMAIKDLPRDYNLENYLIYERLRAGWCVEEAILIPKEFRK